jgi:hypothetical protein
MSDEMPDDVPEADALEQRQEVVPEPGQSSVDDGFEVPEADALDQAREVPLDDEPDPED